MTSSQTPQETVVPARRRQATGAASVADDEVALRDGRGLIAPAGAAPEAAERRRSGAAAIVLASLAVIVGLWWGRSFMVPLTAGLMLAMLVTPVANWLERVVRVRVVAATLTMVLVVASIGVASASFGGQLARVAGRAPDMISLVAQELSEAEPEPDSLLTRARVAFAQLDRAADRFAGAKPLIMPTAGRRAAAAPPAASAAVAGGGAVKLSESATVALRESAVSGSGAVLKLAGDLTIVFFIAFFLLAGGSPLARHFLDLFGSQDELRARAERAIAECVRQIRIYGGVLLVTNIAVGLGVWVAFAWAGLPDAGGWGITAAVLHVVPYLGMALLTCLGAFESFLAHGTLASAVGMAAYIVVLSTIIGTIVTAWLQGRAAKMNPAAVFIGVVFWGALWGAWGLLLGPALVVLMKVIAEHSRAGQPLARLMQG